MSTKIIGAKEPRSLNVPAWATPDNMRYICYSNDYEGDAELRDRRLCLFGEILATDNDMMPQGDASESDAIVQQIFNYNREDAAAGLSIGQRKPIRMYINSPGGSVTQGMAIISAIRLSKTPVYTINVGEWSSMAFLIGISGHKRFSMPDMIFLMHDGSTLSIGSMSKVQDKMEFDRRYEQEVVKRLVLSRSNMTSAEYDALARVEYYMLPEDALGRGFIDQIVTDINDIL
ncbi:ATP-dependent Clp protease proteolytic subunit [Candidatus Saccharibacteria bacterium]|nr:ATP-dependent Clp protease proteolytic subunit [Candidatus Saccharibacteria bacterium]